MHRINALLLVGLLALPLPLPQRAAAQDTALFSNSVAPNVMLMVDNSGSMEHMVWHPAFDPSADPLCDATIGGVAINDDTTYDYSSNITATTCGNSRTVYIDPALSEVRILGRYLNWLFSDLSDPYHKGTANNDADNIQAPANGQRSACLIAEGLPATYSRYRRSRITASKDVLREVICQVNQAGDVRFGLTQFEDESEPEGGFVAVPIDDYDAAHGAAIDSFISNLNAETWTPLGETLYNVYRYFQSRTNPAFGKDDTTPFPAYNLSIANDGETIPVGSAPGTPVQLECQKNFVIIITDGEPTKDDFDNMDPATFATLIGDFNTDNTLPEAGNEEVGNGDETAWYLDDIAKFMHEKDFQRDFAGDQTLDIYTIGFTTNPTANAILQKTAAVGGGLFRQSNNAEELTAAIVSQILSIIQKSQSFTAATVPASRTTDGESFYSTYFRPLAATPFWDGHLKAFKFTQTGDVLTDNDKCAIGDPTQNPPCPQQGELQNAEPGVWDASTAMPDPEDRKLFIGDRTTAFGADPRPWFTNTSGTITHTIAQTDLRLEDVADVDLAQAPYNLPNPNVTADLDGLTPQIVSSLAGCRFGTMLGTDCDPREADGVDTILGDIFHSNPVVVGSPNARVNHSTYAAFAISRAQRDKVIYAGSNDGWMHGFHAGDWDTGLTPPRHDRGTGVELFGFMPSEIRESIWAFQQSQPFGSVRTLTTVDGSPAAADVWMYRSVPGTAGCTDTDPATVCRLGNVLSPPVSTTRAMEQWRTVLVGGLRDGGDSFFALDITNPGETGYPSYLWETPCDINEATGDCTGSPGAINPNTHAWRNWFGSSWSEPVITRVKVAVDGQPGAHERWVAVIGSGYDICGDPNNPAYDDQAASETCDASNAAVASRGRGIFMIDITTGEILAAKVWTATDTSDVNGDQYGYDELQYAFASSPAVFDINFDGYADVIYIGDLGGRMWKWVVTATGDDPIHNSTANNSIGQPDWPFTQFFAASPSTGVTPTHYQSFFAPPTAAYRHGELTLAWGAGERANLANGTLDTNAVNNNHFYVVEDSDPFLVLGSQTTLTESDLVDVTNNIESDGTTVAQCSDFANSKGYYLTGDDREKFFVNAVIFLGDVITGSYVPADLGANSCNASGVSYFYRFNLRCGTGEYSSNSSSKEKRRKAVGGGIPTRPRVSVGGYGGGGGGGGGGCDTKLVMITSDGEILNEGGDCPDSSGIGIRTWRAK